MKMKKKYLEIIGWYGVTAIIIAYALNSFSVLDSSSWIYQILNLSGAICIIFHSISKKDYQPAVLNIIWSIIAIFALLKVFFTL